MKITTEKKRSGATAHHRVASHCLIAADVDKTVLAQTAVERTQFVCEIAPQLIEAAKMGASLAFITGNSLSQLTNRFLKWMIEQLCNADCLECLDQFHFFCNSGGVYFRFSAEDIVMARLLSFSQSNRGPNSNKTFRTLTIEDHNGERVVRPRYIDSGYIVRAHISADETLRIQKILEECAEEYVSHVTQRMTSFAKCYDLQQFTKGGHFIRPSVDPRFVKYGFKTNRQKATVQLTLKPVLSFRHGVDKGAESRLFEKDLRTWLLDRIQLALDARGLGHYVARAGGRSSIDITLEKLDKAYALEFLIDHLNLQGHARLGQRFASNAIYFGDEVIVGGGNDYPVTRIPGLLVLAVNPDRQLIPFLHRVLAPSSVFDGPAATAEILNEFNKIARTLIYKKGAKAPQDELSAHESPLDLLKVDIFSRRIRNKIENLQNKRQASPDDWQILHAFVTLMHREDPAARQWLTILINELDAIMLQIAENPKASTPGIGASYHE